jgi:hypothetical protein
MDTDLPSVLTVVYPEIVGYASRRIPAGNHIGEVRHAGHAAGAHIPVAPQKKPVLTTGFLMNPVREQPKLVTRVSHFVGRMP